MRVPGAVVHFDLRVHRLLPGPELPPRYHCVLQALRFDVLRPLTVVVLRVTPTSRCILTCYVLQPLRVDVLRPRTAVHSDLRGDCVLPGPELPPRHHRRGPLSSEEGIT